MEQDTAYLFNLLNSACNAMFVMFKELELPEEIIDTIIANNPKALDNAVDYLKQNQVDYKDKIVKATAIRWAITTIAICGQCGMKLEKDIQKESIVSSAHNNN
jgi:uncharacterized protein YdcH (DUF465 family)